MGAYCAIDRQQIVLAIGRDPDDCIGQVSRLDLSRLQWIIPCTDDVVACFVAFEEVMVNVVNRRADV